MQQTFTNVPGTAFNPLQYAVSTRMPDRYDVMSAWTGHVPFAMTVVDMVRPRLLVELGTCWGVSYCGFCQAVRELQLPTQCFAVDTWEGDPHSSFYTEEVFENLNAYHRERYSSFSNLIRSTFDDALQQFQDGTIDLLHIDGYHTYEAVRHDFETWLPKMTARGVILFHDTEVRDREDFGVWRFWDEVKLKYPYFEFLHSYGLGVLAVGPDVPEGLRPLLALAPADQALVRAYFGNLGARLVELNEIAMQKTNAGHLLAAKTEECRRLETALEATRDTAGREIAALEAARDTAGREIAALEAARAAAAGEAAALQARLGQRRYRAVDRVARIAGKASVLSDGVRTAVGTMVRLVRKPG